MGRGLSRAERRTLRRAARKPWSQALPHELLAVKERHGLPGIALCYLDRDEDSPKIPGPIEVPFEPVELNRPDALLRMLREQGDPTLSDPWLALSCLSEMTDDEQHALRSRLGTTGFWSRAWSVLALLPLLGLCVTPILAIVITVLLGRALGLPEYRLLAAILMIGVLCAAALLVVHSRRRRWLLVPGGVVIRRAKFGSASWELARHTPGDTVLVIAKSRGLFHRPLYAQLWRDGQRVLRVVGVAECVALLGAWQSPLRPPEIDEMIDLK